MIYEIRYSDGRCNSRTNGSKDLIKRLALLKDEHIADIRKLYKSGVSDSVMEKYEKYTGR
ncbi:hypothetical protein DXB46_15420 [Lachnospiraceae bacterium OM04-12BH]|nr:hypothetical protein DXB46_15420 [Lachnospiraceae bacterium OM04-12BH]